MSVDELIAASQVALDTSDALREMAERLLNLASAQLKESERLTAAAKELLKR